MKNEADFRRRGSAPPGKFQHGKAVALQWPFLLVIRKIIPGQTDESGAGCGNRRFLHPAAVSSDDAGVKSFFDPDDTA